MVVDLIKGDYQSVLDHFLMRYSLPSDFDVASKFHKAMAKADKDLKFKTKNDEAVYKLKLAKFFFFTEGLTKPLNKDCFEIYKENITVAANLDNALFEGEQLLNDVQYDKNQKQLEEMDKYLLNKLGVGFRR